MTYRVAFWLASCILLSAGLREVESLGSTGHPSSPRSQRVGVGTVDRIGPDEIATALSRVSPQARGVVFPGSRDGNAQYIFNRRTDPSDVERHDDWDDILVFQSGFGSVHYGGTWKNAKPIYQGESRGGFLESPDARVVGPGDVIRIAAGEAHRVVPLGDAPLTYLVVKIRRGKNDG